MDFQSSRPGHKLREIRLGLHMTLRAVDIQTGLLAERLENSLYRVTASHLSYIEKTDSVPSLHKVASLAHVYGLGINEMFNIFGIELESVYQQSRSASGVQPV